MYVFVYIYISIIMMSLNHDVQFARQSSSESLAGSLSRQTSLSDMPDLVARTSVDVVGAQPRHLEVQVGALSWLRKDHT